MATPPGRPAPPPGDGAGTPEPCPQAERRRAGPTRENAEPAEPDPRPAEDGLPFGHPGRPLDRRSPFFVGMAGAAGVAVAYGVMQTISAARTVLILIGLAFFIAAGLDPLVSWLVGRRVPRWAAIAVVVAGLLGAVGGFLAAAIPPLTTQAADLAGRLPHYMHSLRDHNSQLGRLDQRFHIQQRLTGLLSGGGSSLLGGLLGAGQMVLSAAASTLVVLVLVIYFLAGMPSIKGLLYHLAPRSRRARVVLISEDIFTKIGGFVLGNIITSLIAGAGTYVWLLIFGVPYAVLLAVFVAFMDLIPVIGSTIGGIVVSLVALTVSLPVAIATAGFYVVYRQAEDYLLVPKVMGRAVEVPAIVTVLATLIGGTLLGIIGALVAIPVAAAIRLLLNEITLPRLERS